jgi:hypothetical protein
LLAVLLLEISPVFREFPTEKVVPAYCLLLFEKTLISRRVWFRVNMGVAEELKKAFTEDVGENWVEE